MKYLFVLSMLFVMSCGSDSDSKNETDTVPEALRGGWVQDCDTLGFDNGSLNTTQAVKFEFTSNTGALIRTIYEENNCTGNIFAVYGYDGRFSEIESIITSEGVEGTAAEVTLSNGDTITFAYHLSGDLMFMDAWYPGSNSVVFDFTQPFYRE